MLDADIAKCFDCINHNALLDKLNYRGEVRQQVKAWLKSGVIDKGHTFIREQSEDGKVGFDFLGYYIRQYPSGRHKSARNGASQIFGFNTLITPSKQSLAKHQESIKKTIKKHKYPSQIDLIKDLNPIIRRWCNYYSFSDANTTGEFSQRSPLTCHKCLFVSRGRLRTVRSISK